MRLISALGNSNRSLLLILLVLLSAAVSAEGPRIRPASELSNDYIVWMKKVADWQLTQSSWNSSVTWERGALHAGMMACYEATKDETYLDKSRQFAQKFNWQLASTSHHADNNAVGQDYMELYFLDVQDPARYMYFKNVSDSHVDNPTHFYCNIAGGNETWWWCDALFMAPPGLVRLSRALSDSKYIDFMHWMWQETQDCLYDAEEHLFFRDITYFDDRYNGKKVFWSRGNGWVLAGTARVLQYLPLDDPNRPRYINLLQEMSAKLITLQQPDGYWRSDLLSPEHYDNPESSGTGFFTYGIAWGINNGFLDEQTYAPAAQAGWEALKAAVQPNGLLGWVQPVGAGPTGTTAMTTDVFGVGAYLLAGSEMQKYAQQADPASIEYFESYLTTAALLQKWEDGTTNGTSSAVTLGDYGDNFLQLTYQNDQSPYRSQTDYTFAVPKNCTVNNSEYLSVLVRGNSSNAADSIYVRLEDSAGHAALQVVADPNVVRTPAWTELAFPLADFTGIDLNHIGKLSIGIGLPEGSSPAGQGTIRIDNIRLFPVQCQTVREDFSGDCVVNFEDFAILAGQWLDQYVEVIPPTDPGTANLIAYWSLDGNANDLTGNGYDALAGSTVVFDQGHTGQSACFDGTDYQSYLYCQNSTGMHLDQGATVSAWVKSTGLVDSYASVITKGVQAWRLIRNNNAGSISFHFNSAFSGEYQANGGTSVVDGQWHHLAGVYDGSTVRLYVDGQLDASGYAGPVRTTSDLVYIGSRVGRLTDRNWNGWIDEVRIYNTALSEAHILYLAQAQPHIDNPRATDLVVNGVIDLEDLSAFVLTWLGSNFWP
jgi:rhamnogalacturonyl hydrolase YesR